MSSRRVNGVAAAVVAWLAEGSSRSTHKAITSLVIHCSYTSSAASLIPSTIHSPLPSTDTMDSTVASYSTSTVEINLK